MTDLNTNKDLDTNSGGVVDLLAEYSFANPYSINGPFGDFSLTLSGSSASGTFTITTLFGLGTKTKLVYQAVSKFDGSTGYTTIVGKGSGTLEEPLKRPRHVTADITISLQPGFKEGTVDVSGYLSKYKCTATAIHYPLGTD